MVAIIAPRVSCARQRAKRYAELRGNPENHRIKSRWGNTNWYLETGTSRMQSYPFMSPAVKTVMREQGDSIAAEADSVEEVVRGIAFAIEKEAKNYASTGVPPGPDEITGNLKGSIEARRM